MREHLENYERQLGRPHPTLADAPRLPFGAELLWRDFMALHLSRASTGYGPARISFADIDAYQRVQGARLPAWQIDAIRRADTAYLVHYAETHKAPGK